MEEASFFKYLPLLPSPSLERDLERERESSLISYEMDVMMLRKTN